MNAFRRALTGNEPDHSSDGDLANLCCDDELIDVLDTAQARLALVEELETVVNLDNGLSQHPRGASGALRGRNSLGGTGGAPLLAGPATPVVGGITTGAGLKLQQHQHGCCGEDQLIGDVASSESTSLLDDSSDESGADGGSPPPHCHQSLVGASMDDAVKGATWKLSCAFALGLCFMATEMIGAYISNSTAIYSDAAHMLTDLTGFGLSIAAITVSSQRKPTSRLPFGFYRAEVLGAVASVLLIWVVTGILVYASITRIQTGDFEIDADTMMLVSTAGVVMNTIMAAILHGSLPCLPKLTGRTHCHSHGTSLGRYSGHGGHGEQGHISLGGGGNHGGEKNINVRAAMVHVFGDLLQSIGVLISAYFIKNDPALKLADPICTFIFSALVLATTVGIMRDACAVLMEAFPRKLNYAALRLGLEAVPGVRHVHSLRAWSLSMERIVFTAHLAVDTSTNRDMVMRAAQRLLRKRFRLSDITLQIEIYDRQAIALCEDCQL
ncbi:zinc transporter 2-like [Tropilaelaps mercedesae]|uniref:Zinc transporter 2-like n=1 Tax=Tropilaelaps mercedesae TaxID=418985 RepID=A0A1V9XBQ5_9ACAR|nr:zinc transporter 2-like [Tropilaelaps mercedesae]